VSGARNVISGNTNDGVLIEPGVSGVQVQGNYIGTNASGTIALGNSVGVYVNGSNNTIGGTAARNVISGNSNDGVFINDGVSSVQVLGDYIGTNAEGTGKLGNNVHGVDVYGSNNTIGGTTSGARNVISGNSGVGVYIKNGVSGVQMQGNYIGINSAGTSDLGNYYGVFDQGSNNTIGGTTTAACNIISGNNNDGVYLGGSGESVRGNYIGTNATGTGKLGNSSNGIEVAGTNNTIGGTTSGTRNIISGNGSNGVRIDSTASGTAVLGNAIGRSALAAALGNGSYGVRIAGNKNSIGGSVAGAGNSIAFNKTGGVVVSAGSGDTVLDNVIFANGPSNTGPGITLDSGANNNVAAPTLNSATLSGSTLTAKGTFTALTANVPYVLEFFANINGDVEGFVFLGLLTVTPKSTGTQSFTVTATVSASTPPFIAATLTDNLDNTSEFSNGVTTT
jgi:titin